MTRDELEFSISQYLDGTLAENERNAIESRLGSDAEARAIFAEYESLHRSMRAAPLPAVNWDNLSRHISATVAREELPATSYKISAWLRPMRLAIAASIVVAAATLAFVFSRDRGTQTPIAATPVSIVKLDAPAPESDGVAVSNEPISVAIVPPSATDDVPVVLRYADSVVQRPSKALIVSAAPTVQDSSQTPF